MGEFIEGIDCFEVVDNCWENIVVARIDVVGVIVSAEEVVIVVVKINVYFKVIDKVSNQQINHHHRNIPLSKVLKLITSTNLIIIDTNYCNQVTNKILIKVVIIITTSTNHSTRVTTTKPITTTEPITTKPKTTKTTSTTSVITTSTTKIEIPTTL